LVWVLQNQQFRPVYHTETSPPRDYKGRSTLQAIV